MRKVVFLDSAFQYAKMQSYGLTNKSAADEMGISYSTYSKWINWAETNKFPNKEHIKIIAAYINWDYDDLYLAVLAAKESGTSLEKKIEGLIPKKVLKFSKKI